MIQDVDGDSRGSLFDYYHRAEIEIKNTVNSLDEGQILQTDTDELTKYFISQYILPLLEIDPERNRIYKKEKSSSTGWTSYLNMTIGIPLLPYEDLDKVVSYQASSWLGGFSFGLEDGYLTTMLQVQTDSSNMDGHVKQNFEYLEQTINHKNQSISEGNRKLEQNIRSHIEQIKNRLRKENESIESAIKKIPIKLEQKDHHVPMVDLKMREKIRVVMPRPQQKYQDPELEAKTLQIVIDLIDRQCESFELTPKAFAKMEEELLRDQILAMLNTIFTGSATGESFVRTGKTDILLRHPDIKGHLLSSECKFWGGEKLYSETINQHFRYLTLRQNHAIQITFSTKKGFTDVVEKAVEATKSHATYVKDSISNITEKHFLSIHTFPEDPKKKIEIHHLIYNLYVPEK